MKQLPLLFVILCLPGLAQVIIEPIPRHPHHPPVQRPAPLQIREIAVNITIKDQLATTRVDHVFYNPGHRWREGTFLFPLPPGAKLTHFSMWINGRETEAELLDAKKAERIYQDIVRNQRDPALLQYSGGGLLKARIFPIEAHAEKKVRLEYQHILAMDGSLNRYNQPLRACRLAGGTIARFSMKARIHTRKPLQTAYSPTHPFAVDRDGEHRARLTYEATNLEPDRDLELLLSSGGKALGMDLLCHTDGSERYFWLTLMPNLESSEIIAKDVAFVLDCSGSMSGKKMKQAKAALRFCIENLNDGDRFQIVRFSTEASSLAKGWLAADGEQRQRAIHYIDELRAIGGTNLGDGLKLVNQLPQSQGRARFLILLSDGKPTIGERDEQRLLQQIDSPWRIFPFGIGFEINTHLLDKLARDGGGKRTYVTPEEDLELKLSALYRKIQAPVLGQLQLRAEGVQLGQTHPKQLPDLFQGTPLHLFGTYEGGGKAALVLEGDINGKRKGYRFEAEFPAENADNAFIPGLWAQRRVGYLLDQIRMGGEERELIDEVVRLARRYGIVTPYTSYLILEDEADQVSGGRRLLPRQSRDEAGKAYRQMKEKSGEASVTASRAMQKMARADSIDSDKKAGGCQTILAGGRAFYLQGETWIDSDLAKVRTSKRKQIRYSSEAWFALLKEHPELKDILALGSHIHFHHEGTIYEVN